MGAWLGSCGVVGAGMEELTSGPRRVNRQLEQLNPAMGAEQMQFGIDTLKRDRFVEAEGTDDSRLGHFTAERRNAIYGQLVGSKAIAKPIGPVSACMTKYAP